MGPANLLFRNLIDECEVITAQKNLLRAPHTHPTWHSPSRDRIWAYWKLSAGSGMADVLCCSGHTCVWLRLARCRRGGVCRWACASSWGALFSLTQVTFQPFPLPSSALSSAQPMVGVGGQGGRESHHLLRAASTPSIPPPCILCPLCTPTCRHAKPGWPVFCGGASAVSSCSQAAGGGGRWG